MSSHIALRLVQKKKKYLVGLLGRFLTLLEEFMPRRLAQGGTNDLSKKDNKDGSCTPLQIWQIRSHWGSLENRPRASFHAFGAEKLLPDQVFEGDVQEQT